MDVALLSSGMVLILQLMFGLEQCRDLAATRHPGKAEVFCLILVFRRLDRVGRLVFLMGFTVEG